MKRFNNNKGSMFVVLIIAMTVIAVLGAVFVSMVVSKQQGFTLLLNGHRANMIARSGIEWAIRFASEGNPVSGSRDFVPGTPKEGSFISNYNDDTDVLTVDGTYQGTTQRITLSKFRRYLRIGDVSFPLSMDSFKPVESQAGRSIAVEETGVIHLGLGAWGTSGTVWYGGNSAAGNCVNGRCDFGSGFRAYFVFQFAPGSTGDGFTFAIINGDNNNAKSIGGDSNMGELMAYGGDSRLYGDNDYITSFVDGLGYGLRPPKFAVEFDIYPNTNCSQCSGRCDRSNEHMAYVFWGDDKRISCWDYTKWINSFLFPANTLIYGRAGFNTYFFRQMTSGNPRTGAMEPNWATCINTGTECVDNQATWQKTTTSVTPINYITNSRTYDDNQHTAGTEGDEGSSESGTGPLNVRPGTDGTYNSNYYTNLTNPATWLADGINSSTVNSTYAFRMEVVRTSATGTYQIKSWIKNCDRTWNPSTVYAINDQVRPTDNKKYYYIAQTAGTSGSTEPSWSPAGTVTDGTVTWAAIPIWSPSTPYAINNVIRPTVNKGYYYIAQTAGTSGSTEPTWRATATVTDGSITWAPIPMTVCDQYTNGTLGDVQSDYIAADNPTLVRAITLDSVYNAAFNKFLFGWTTASGGATQKADVWKFRLTFKP